MKKSIHLERINKYWVSKVYDDESYQERMDELENSAKRKIEDILDKNVEDTMENVLKQIDYNIELENMKKSAWTIDTFKLRIKKFLFGILEE